MEQFRNIFEDIVGKSAHNSRWQAIRQRLESSELTIANLNDTRKRSRIRDPATTCNGLVALMTYDPTNSTWTPKKCSRGCLPNSQYCKTHGKNTQHIICQQCTEHLGHEVRHNFLHEHFGIVNQPSYHFSHPQFRDKIIKQSQKDKKINKDKDNNTINNDNNNQTKKIKKQRKQRSSDSPIIPNAFMSWLKVNRAQIKAEIQNKNPEMSAKDLMVSTTKQAGILWKALDKSEQEKWKNSSNNINNNQESSHDNTNTILDSNDIIQIIPNNTTSDSVPPSNETEPETPLAIEQDDDESVVLTFNETHKVWVEDATGLYYKDNNSDQPPMGQIVAGKLVPFKKTTRTLTNKKS